MKNVRSPGADVGAWHSATRRSGSLRRFPQFTLGFNLAVILWGAYVRASGSGAGCGRHWPLCNGVVVPRGARLETLVEFGHRVTSGIALALIVGLVVWAFRATEPGHRLRRAAVASLVFIVTEALIGAGLVTLGLVGQDSSLLRIVYLPLHLANTFCLIAALTLAALWADRPAPVPPARQATSAVGGWVTLGLILLVATTGAVTALGDTLFPVGSLGSFPAEGVSPAAQLLVRLRVVHPALAVLGAVVACVVGYRAISRFGSRAVERPARWLIGLSIGQLAMGTLNLLLAVPIATQLLHLLLADLMWIAAVAMTAGMRET